MNKFSTVSNQQIDSKMFSEKEILKMYELSKKNECYSFDCDYSALGFYTIYQLLSAIFYPKIQNISLRLFRKTGLKVDTLLCGYKASQFLDSYNLFEKMLDITCHEGIQKLGNLLKVRDLNIYPYNIDVCCLSYLLDEFFDSTILLFNKLKLDNVYSMQIFNLAESILI